MWKKRMCLTVANFAVAVFLMAAAPLIANAEDFQGSDGWLVEFLGAELISNFQSNQIQEEIYNIQPGDSVYFEVALTNKADFTTDWYMTNEVLSTLEESNNCAEGGAYTYILTYVDPEGTENVLYNSEVVGGEEDTTLEGEGLHQATNNLEEYFFLDRLQAGEGGSVSLYVKLDGETQGNDYQDTLARLQVNFAVEKVLTETITNHITITERREITNIITNAPKTGDETPIALFSVLALGCGILLFVLALSAMKRNRHEKGEQHE